MKSSKGITTEMKNSQKERLIHALASQFNTVHEIFQAFDRASAPSLAKASWDDVVKAGDHLSKQATIFGMLWTGEDPDHKTVQESMEAFFNALQTLLLLAHGSLVDAGLTLSSNIHNSVKQIVDSSFKFITESVSSYGSHDISIKNNIPQLVGAVWEACSSLKKTPSTNITAIGRELTKIAVSVKDVLREMQELKMEDNPNETDENAVDRGEEDEEFGNDLSSDEMKVVQTAVGVVSEVIMFIKELIRTISGSVKQENTPQNGRFVDSLENLLTFCRELGEQTDELGACLYPPQEASTMAVSLTKISRIVMEISQIITSLESSSDIPPVLDRLRSSVKSMEFELNRVSMTDLPSDLQRISL